MNTTCLNLMRVFLPLVFSAAMLTVHLPSLQAQSQTELEAEKTLVWKMLYQGDFAKARDILAPLCNTARDSKEIGQKSVFYLECLSLLGAVELRSGMLTEAAGHLTEAKDGFARKRRSFKDDYRQMAVRGQIPAFAAYAGHVTGHFCRDLDWLGEVRLEEQAFDEARLLFDESLKAREAAAIADGIAPNSPAAAGLTMSKHSQGLYYLRKGELTRARHYLEAANSELEAQLAPPAVATESTEPATAEPPAATSDVNRYISAIDQTFTHVSLLTHLGELELAEGNFPAAQTLAKKAIDVGRAGLGEKHGVVLEPTLLLVATHSADADKRLATADPRGARAALQAANAEYSKIETLLNSFWVPSSPRRLKAAELGGSLRERSAAIATAVANLDDAEKAADVAMTKAGEGSPPTKTTTKRRIIRRVVPKKPAPADGTPTPDGTTPPAAPAAKPAEPAPTS